MWAVRGTSQKPGARRSSGRRRRTSWRPRVGPEAGARGASASARREPRHLLGPTLEAAARGEEVEPGESRAPGTLRPGAAGVGQQHEGAPPQNGEGKRITEANMLTENVNNKVNKVLCNDADAEGAELLPRRGRGQQRRWRVLSSGRPPVSSLAARPLHLHPCPGSPHSLPLRLRGRLGGAGGCCEAERPSGEPLPGCAVSGPAQRPGGACTLQTGEWEEVPLHEGGSTHDNAALGPSPLDKESLNLKCSRS